MDLFGLKTVVPPPHTNFQQNLLPCLVEIPYVHLSFGFYYQFLESSPLVPLAAMFALFWVGHVPLVAPSLSSFTFLGPSSLLALGCFFRSVLS